MGWKQRWPDRQPRPEVQPLSKEAKEHTLGIFREGIEVSPVLSALGVSAQTRRGRFYFERIWPIPGEPPQVEVIGRATPLLASPGNLLLEAERQPGNWHEFVRGSARKVVNAMAGDTKGTFHGLGALDASLRQTGGGANRREVQKLNDQFTYAETGAECTFHEALFHFFGLPIDVIAEPRQWYIYQREPRILEVSEDQAQILVAFTARGWSGSFSGFCLYAIVDGQWRAFTLKPNQSGDISTAVAWLKKRDWQPWN
jgi:hypothetical protein